MKRLICGLLMLLAAACSTTVDVKRVTDGNATGLRYYLPRPFLMVTPAADGTITVTKVYLPDLDRQYAVTSQTLFAKHKLNVEVTDEGFLSNFGSKGDSTDVAKDVLDKTSAFLKARNDADATAAQKQKDALKAAEDAVDKADAEVKAINAEIEQIQNAGSDITADKKAAMLLDARIRLAKAQLELDAAVKARDALKATSGGVLNLAGSAAQNLAGGGDAFRRTWGPVLLRVIDDGNSVRLEKVDWTGTVTQMVNGKKTITDSVAPQKKFATQTIKQPEVPKSVAGSVRQQLKHTADKLKFTIDSDTPLTSVSSGILALLRDSNGDPVATSKALTLDVADKKVIHVELGPDLPAGRYTLTYKVEVTEEGKPAGKEMEVTFEVVP